ncbi:bifunctional methylenetetrahydrofolate dehydrogenase/methenyltetrahydrofolate cyclohydrolase FolD [Pseudomonas lalucatii]|uniref:Bifunctional protein FolD n=1 Tax=Pseudomonas lalucatii TaxID=1424203 RepID=A0ABS5Q0F2_9PSED|nr:bifunctional methylenetetrahydrofolate dehydrogenase/methenyltetrahydrofolate cyclohydrolase FolD [Pseudomonas lalucatii]MBS7661816.1 bifunctional methylenetetrahydrofolate dehydrogenase/methenyltetrahydrofolate cyclohydrolase FolD [Pseudomonas lalucatii]MBS7690626.1 bifunctional methylenetetrahydrofolate dehydrogenase/methenyltetrahydrofolate cyclohydrolase FolD [Pseudomonas lalucatii]QVM88158.1 bifunctional methylenetetrahydrofolate dehydrogenase/methenyltetrahydrofolate cyclohydrolase FolD
MSDLATEIHQAVPAAELIDGKAFAAQLRGEVAEGAAGFSRDTGRQPGLAVVLVGNDPASQVYVRTKMRQAAEVGIASFPHLLDANTGEAELLALIDSLNHDDSVDGILVQLPLPAGISEAAVIEAIAPAKDVDGFHPYNVGRLSAGQPVMVPCTPLGCLLLLQDRLGDLSGLKAVVVGRSNIVGKPMAQLLLNANCTVTTVHSRSRNMAEECRQADILVVAVGRPGLVGVEHIKPGATVLDVGINRVEDEQGQSRLVGDVDFAAASRVAGALTPVPGGIGPMTVACLLRNTLTAARQRTR